MSVLSKLNGFVKTNGAGFIVLIDPDKKNDKKIDQIVQTANLYADAIFVGGSIMMDKLYHERVKRIKSISKIPVILFPGGVNQLNDYYDAMLFMSLLSGRNPHYIIGEQVIAAPIVRDYGIETIPTGYLLVDGGSPTTVEFISGTKPDLLHQKIADKKFRQDLFHKLSVVPIKIPNLSDRTDDIPVLAKHFVEKLSSTNGLAYREFTNDALTFLQGMNWPGNIRQLKNIIERVLILGNPSDQICSDELILPDVKTEDNGPNINSISPELASMALREAREAFERDYLLLQINRFGGNISKTATFVEMERSALHRKLKSLGISSGQKI